MTNLEDAIIGSPLKKQRASLSGADEESLRSKFGLGLVGAQGDVLGRIEQGTATGTGGNNVGPSSSERPLFGESLGRMLQRDAPSSGQGRANQPDQTVKTEEMEEEL